MDSIDKEREEQTPGHEASSAAVDAPPGSDSGIIDTSGNGSPANSGAVANDISRLEAESVPSGAQTANTNCSNEHDDWPQRQARETLKTITAAMAERSKTPLARRNTDSPMDSEIKLPIIAKEPATSTDRRLESDNEPKPAPSIRSLSHKKSSFLESLERKLKGHPNASLNEEQPTTGDQPVEPEMEAMAATNRYGERRQPDSNLTTIMCVAVISGAVGLLIGLNFKQDGSAPVAVADSRFGESAAITLPAGNKDFVSDIVAQVLPTVVSIDVPYPPTYTASAQPGRFGSFSPDGQGQSSALHSIGTGVIVRSDGYIITSAHVARGQPRLYARLQNKRLFLTHMVGKDPFTDLELLKIDADNLPVSRFAPDKKVRPGDWAIAIGTPFGFDHSVSLGIVSAIGRSLADLNNHVELIQTDAAMNPGNSGGPLLNSKGELIGINAVIKSGAQNIGFAVPVDVVRSIAAQLLHGDMKRPYLGIVMDDIAPSALLQAGVDHGVIILRTVHGSPCETAGLAPGDIILELNGVPMRNTREARDAFKQHKPGDVMDFSFFRKGTGKETRKVSVGEYPYE
jgi:S1-C subfamily serine protease